MLDQKTISPVTEAEAALAVPCRHGDRRFADASLTAGCSCEIAPKVTSL